MMRLFWDPIPPPCQAVLLTVRFLNLDSRIELIRVDLMRNQQHNETFLRINSLHQVPVLQEPDGFLLTESRAIMSYLTSKAGGPLGRQVYPPDARKRALCDRWMFFDVTCLWHRLKRYHLPVIERRSRHLDTSALPDLHEALRYLEDHLMRSGGRFVLGDVLTLADLSLVTTVSQADAFSVDLLPYPGIRVWYGAVSREVPGFNQLVAGNREYAAIVRQLIDTWRETSEPEP